jgi:xanthosine utilization system XapX-like protein
VLVPKTVPGFTVIGVLGAFALFFSAFVRHWSFTVVGAVGVLMATVSALGMLGGIAPLVIAVVGLAFIFVGLRWSRWRETIRSAMLARMPEAARSVVSRLAP